MRRTIEEILKEFNNKEIIEAAERCQKLKISPEQGKATMNFLNILKKNQKSGDKGKVLNAVIFDLAFGNVRLKDHYHENIPLDTRFWRILDRDFSYLNAEKGIYCEQCYFGREYAKRDLGSNRFIGDYVTAIESSPKTKGFKCVVCGSKTP